MLPPCYGGVASLDRVATEWMRENLGKVNEWPRDVTEWLGIHTDSLGAKRLVGPVAHVRVQSFMEKTARACATCYEANA
jgi:hypothetical protein